MSARFVHMQLTLVIIASKGDKYGFSSCCGGILPLNGQIKGYLTSLTHNKIVIFFNVAGKKYNKKKKNIYHAPLKSTAKRLTNDFFVKH